MTTLYINAQLIHRNPVNGVKFAWTRRYKDITTAAAKAMALLIRDGYVGDVIEFTLRVNGMHVGAMKMTAAGKVITTWDSEEAAKLIQAQFPIEQMSYQAKHTASKAKRLKK
jgi:hypothetical protein